MSYLYFHSLHGEAALTGSERSYLNLIGGRYGVATIGELTAEKAERIRTLIRPGSYVARGSASDPAWRRDLAESMALSLFGVPLHWRGTTISANSLVNNAVMRHGDDQMQLAVRLYRQCEVHAWVDGPNRAWLAEIMRAGLERGLYRAKGGWSAVIDLLLAREDEPVVTSSSLNTCFPNAGACRPWDEREYQERDEDFLSLPEHEQWRAAMAGLRSSEPVTWRELTPARWGPAFHFRHGLALEDLLADDYADRLDKALAGYNPEEEGL